MRTYYYKDKVIINDEELDQIDLQLKNLDVEIPSSPGWRFDQYKNMISRKELPIGTLIFVPKRKIGTFHYPSIKISENKFYELNPNNIRRTDSILPYNIMSFDNIIVKFLEPKDYDL